MDVPRHEFQAKLPYILEDIANAHFISIDLELSGIPGPQINKSRANGAGSNGKPTLQERYNETKSAVERYQVLQLGITCVLEDRINGHYTLKPYNFFLNPIPNERLNIERIFAYQSGAVGFLLGHKFRMEAPFLEGVPYFSREEEATARRLRDERAVYTDIDVDRDDIESLKFVKAVSDEIEAWKARRGPKDTFLNISNPESHQSQASDRGLNNFQKALVYQIVRKHPELVAVNRQSFIQIIDYDEQRETQLKYRRLRYFEKDLEQQIGLRWVVEAMVGGDLSGLDPNDFLTYVEGRQEEVVEEVKALKALLDNKRTVLVGHNIFMDLMYFYKCFFGTLPARVEDFQRIIHNLFPSIIDTKFLATYNLDNPAMANSSLEQLNVELEMLPFDKVPIINLDEKHGNYFCSTLAHEAGFDSYLTAKVLIRLATKLEAAGSYFETPVPSPAFGSGTVVRRGNARASPAVISSNEDYFTLDEGGVHINANYHSTRTRVSDSNSGGVPVHDNLYLQENDIQTYPKGPKCKSARKMRKAKLEDGSTRFAHKGMFDMLRDLPTDMDGSVEVMEVEEPPSPAPVMMPPFDSHFWDIYGNKLRVNGTVEGVCDLLGT